MIRFVNILPNNQPFLRGIVAFEEAGDGRIYYASEIISVLFVKQVLTKHGRKHMAAFRRNVKLLLSESVARRERSVADATGRIDLVMMQIPARTHEEMLRLLELPPE